MQYTNALKSLFPQVLTALGTFQMTPFFVAFNICTVGRLSKGNDLAERDITEIAGSHVVRTQHVLFLRAISLSQWTRPIAQGNCVISRAVDLWKYTGAWPRMEMILQVRKGRFHYQHFQLFYSRRMHVVSASVEMLQVTRFLLAIGYLF